MEQFRCTSENTHQVTKHYFQVMGGEGRGGAIIVFYSSADPVHQRMEPGEGKMYPPQISLRWKVFLYVDDLDSSEAEAEGIGPLLMIIDKEFGIYCTYFITLIFTQNSFIS